MKQTIQSGFVAVTAATLLLSASAFASTQTKSMSTTKAVSPVFFRSASNSMAPAIRVNVNGESVDFTNGEPVESEGRILVPLRGVFEKLGASVTYETDSRTIRAVRGETTIMLRPGEETAEINGEIRPISSPAQIVNGAAVVPLRFISEALGAQVKWDPNNYEVAVNTDAQTAVQLPTAPGSDAVTGTVTGLYPEANVITVRQAGGDNVRVPLASEVSTTRKTLGDSPDSNATTQTALVFAAGSTRLGEQVTIQRNTSGLGEQISVDTDLRRGEIKSIESLPTTGGNQITLTDGNVIALAPNAPVTFGDRPVPLSSLKPSEKVVIRLSADGEGLSMAVITPANPNVIPALPKTTTKAMLPMLLPEPAPAPAPPSKTP